MLRSRFEAKEGTRLLYWADAEGRIPSIGEAGRGEAPRSAPQCACAIARDPDACWELGEAVACAQSPAPGRALIPVPEKNDSVHLPRG